MFSRGSVLNLPIFFCRTKSRCADLVGYKMSGSPRSGLVVEVEVMMMMMMSNFIAHDSFNLNAQCAQEGMVGGGGGGLESHNN